MASKGFTIANTASLSGSINIAGQVPTAIGIDALTGTSLTFQVASAKGTFRNLYDDTGTEVTMTVAVTARTTMIPAAISEKLSGFARIKVRTGTAGSPTAQAAARTLELFTQ